LEKRHRQGWVSEVCTNLSVLVSRVKEAKTRGEAVSIGFLVRCIFFSSLPQPLVSQFRELNRKKKIAPSAFRFFSWPGQRR
jgi:hypothetical protein